MIDNLELIKELISLDKQAPAVLLEMLRKNKENEYGKMTLNYENGKVTIFKSERCYK